MTTLVYESDAGMSIEIVKGIGEWYMVYVGRVMAIQVQKNDNRDGYFYKMLRTSVGINLPLEDAMEDALKKLCLDKEVHKKVMKSFISSLQRRELL